MSVYNKITNSVADAVSKIMNEKLTPNQQKIDVVDDEKIDAKDFKKLRAMKKEETEQIQEKEGYSAKAARAGKDIGKPGKMFSTIAKGAAEKYGSEEAGKRVAGAVLAKLRKEDTEQIQEYTSVGGKYVHRQKEVKDAEAGVTDWDKEEKMAKDADKPAAKKRAYGAHQNRRTNTKLYKEMIESLKTGGMKSLFKTIEENKIAEEASEEEFNKELADQKAKFDGKKKTADVAKPSVQAVQNEATHTEVQLVDLTDASQKPQISTVDLEEKTLTAAETAKKEEVAKSMKKGLAGFKERYGNRAKSVMYATATKIAKEKA